MKTTLLSLAFLATFAAFNKANAQCTISSSTVTSVQKNECTFNFDLNFNLKNNNGNKVTVVYIYSVDAYNALPPKFYGTNDNKVPTSSDLNSANVLAVIKINTDSALTMHNYQKVSTTFERPTNMKSSLSYSVEPGGQFTIKNIPLTFTDCSNQITLRADVLSSQSSDLTSVGCVARGMSFSPNEPIIRALENGCGSTRSVKASFETIQERTINFRLFKDVEPMGQFTAADTAAANVVSDWYSAKTVLNVNTGAYTSTGDYHYTAQSDAQFNLWVVAYTPGIPNVSTGFASNTCSPRILPTVFRGVSAQRVKENVLVKWETATEENNRGFNVQRQVGSGAWQSLGFVASKATGGNSADLLSYSFSDMSPAAGTSQYRIQQVNNDGNVSYSGIRSVRNEEVAGKVVVYPNPSTNGKVTIAFDGAPGLKDISVNDLAGRTVKRFTGVNDSSVTIENLTEGFYTIQILDRATSKVSVEKLVVKR